MKNLRFSNNAEAVLAAKLPGNPNAPGSDTITVVGTNDPALIGPGSGHVTEDSVPSTGGTLSITDVDDGEAAFRPQTSVAGTYGSFSLDAAGNCALRACELDSRLAWRTNVEGLVNLASIVAERDVRLVHASIDGALADAEALAVPAGAQFRRNQ